MMADINGVTLSPPPFREQLSYAQTQLLTSVWQRWMDRWWQQHTALWQQGQGGTWQPLDPTLTALAALTGTADTVPYFSGTDVMAVTPLSAYSRTLLDDGDGGTWRSTLGLGTLSVQNANAVAITGGTASGLTTLTADSQSGGTIRFDGPVGMGAAPQAGVQLTTGTAPSYFGGTVQVAGQLGIGTTPIGDVDLIILQPKTAHYGMVMRNSGTDTGRQTVLFQNVSATVVGSIDATATATSYNTSSDVRLKHSTKPLTNVLDSIRALRPISHRWNADGSYGEGFLAHELQQQVPLAVTGEPDAVNPDGSIKPQQVDHAKLIPRLTAGIQDLLALVESLQARVTTLEEALGL